MCDNARECRAAAARGWGSAPDPLRAARAVPGEAPDADAAHAAHPRAKGAPASSDSGDTKK